ncbi:hypothetical protein JQ612_17705 [Bradyrhizobium manausense]|uniref:hypothetical protein n=1 Tax=Bradyrhizobium manausense TaxID=989370 RepID=UPI001BA4E970|nr:hypothetical protein [Bradyrhizobium manausense]MBR0835027.1 hypothetical protein [Bradyrhizobium manausense]
MTHTIPNDTRELKIGELDRVNGGLKGALEGVCRRDAPSGQSDPAQMFQQLLQTLVQ